MNIRVFNNISSKPITNDSFPSALPRGRNKTQSILIVQSDDSHNFNSI